MWNKFSGQETEKTRKGTWMGQGGYDSPLWSFLTLLYPALSGKSAERSVYWWVSYNGLLPGIFITCLISGWPGHRPQGLCPPLGIRSVTFQVPLGTIFPLSLSHGQICWGNMIKLIIIQTSWRFPVYTHWQMKMQKGTSKENSSSLIHSY